MPNANSLPNSKGRRSLKRWMIETFGDGVTALCSFGCGTALTVDTATFDRFPITGWNGGTYRRGNVRPACLSCNSRDGVIRMHARRGHELSEVARQLLST